MNPGQFALIIAGSTRSRLEIHTLFKGWEHCVDSLGEAIWFSTLDAKSGYLLVPIASVDPEKTTLTCLSNTYRSLLIPFGFTNVPTSLQRTLDILLSGSNWWTCLIYLDDIIVFYRSFDAHSKKIEYGTIDATESRCFLTSKKLRFYR